MKKIQKLGRFSISQVSIDKDPELVKLIMGKMIIIRAEIMYNFAVDYAAISDLFDDVTFGSIVPEYDIIVDAYTKNVIAKRK